MDYFNSNFNDDQSFQQEELPEGLGWEDMKEGIYEKMDNNHSSGAKKYWSLLLLLVIGGCGWFAMDFLGEEKRTVLQPPKATVETAHNLSPIRANNPNPSKTNLIENITSATNNNTTSLPQQNALTKITTTNSGKSIASTVLIDKGETNVDTKEISSILSNKSISLSGASAIKSPRNSSSTQTFVEEKLKPATNEEAEKTNKNFALSTIENNSLPRKSENQEQEIEEDWTKVKPNDAGTVETIVKVEEKEKIVLEEDAVEKVSAEKSKSNAFKKYFSIALAAEITNWSFGDWKNVNHDYNSGFPGYSINPSINWHIKKGQSIQLDYGYSFIEELFEYYGSRSVRIKQDNAVVGHVVNSLTGEVISTKRKDISVPGVRESNVIKYNRYKLHTLSLGYQMAKNISTKTELDFYLGASYLINMEQSGKRLNTDLDVIDFDNDNPIFQKNQIGLRLGIGYNYLLAKNTQLFSRIMATQYITNWEVPGSNTATRPFIYGFQMGIRQRLK